MTLNKQNGLGAIRMILMIVLVLVLGIIAGYYYFKSPSKTTFTPTKTSTLIPTTTPTATVTASEAQSRKEICQALFPNCKMSREEAKIDNCLCTVEKMTNNFALGNHSTIVDETGGPGAAWLAAKKNSQWTLLQTTQEMWLCSKLQEYNVPKDFIAGQCLDELTNQIKNY